MAAAAVGPDGGAAPRLLSRAGFWFSLDLPHASHEDSATHRQHTSQRSSRSQPPLALHDAKGGLSGFCPDDAVAINVSVDGSSNDDDGLVRPYLTLEYLSSWMGLGRANVTCHNTCVCNPSLIDAHTPDERASLRALHRLELT